MKLIVEGDPLNIRFVTSICREKVRRGQLILTPGTDTDLDADSIATLREVLEAKTNECVEMAADQLVLANLTEAVVDIVIENGIVIPDDLSDQLAKFITVPKSDETVSKEPEAMEDNKTVDAGEDRKDINLDDAKNAPEADVKSEPSPTRKKTRAKKSE